MVMLRLFPFGKEVNYLNGVFEGLTFVKSFREFRYNAILMVTIF